MKFRDLFDDDFNPKWDSIEKIKEFAELKATPHSAKWHREGSPFEHTKLVVDEMQKYLSLTLSNKTSFNTNYRLIMLSAALCHDLGKAKTTYFDEANNDYVCKNHGLVGEQITRVLFWDEDENILEPVCYMVRWHMTLHHILSKDENTIRDTFVRLSNGLMPVKDMIALWRCDVAGSRNDETAEERAKVAAEVFAAAMQYKCYEDKYVFLNRQDRKCFASGVEYKPSETETVGKFDVYVMIGVPGSGKDTYIKNEFKNHIPVICRDDIRSEIGIKGEKPMGNKKQEEEVTRIFYERFDKYCESGKSFILNNTNVRKKYRIDYIRKLTKYPMANIIYVYMDTPLSLCKERRKGQMPMDVIDRMWKEMEFPTMEEYDELRIIHTVDAYPTLRSNNYWQHNSFANRLSGLMCVKGNGYQIEKRTRSLEGGTKIDDEYIVLDDEM